MKISDAHLKIQIGANLKPDAINLSGATHVGMESDQKTDAQAVLCARLIFSTAAQTAEFDSYTGTFTTSGLGNAQTELVNVTATGVTAGNLALTLTSNKVTGSPLAISVPLTAGMSNMAVAAAIRAKLASLPAVAEWFTVGGESPAEVRLYSIYAFANDTFLNLAIAAGLGVTGVTNSSAGSAGVVGVLIERSSGQASDIYGRTWVEGVLPYSMVVSSSATGSGYCTTSSLGRLDPGQTKASNTANPLTPTELFTAGTSGPCTVDVIMICK